MAMFGSMKPSRHFIFADDECGSASTEWMIAVSIVVMMAVPVLGFVGDGTGAASGDIAIQIEDTDSFGGTSFHGTEAEDADALFLTEDFQPGADKGIGFEGGEVPLGTNLRANRNRPSLASGTSSGSRRDKQTLVRETPKIASGVADRRPFAVPTPPVLVSQKLRVSDDNCVEDIVADVDELEDRQSVPIRVVLASGR